MNQRGKKELRLDLQMEFQSIDQFEKDQWSTEAVPFQCFEPLSRLAALMRTVSGRTSEILRFWL
ncbi:hypothetical protein B9Z51_06880 [Limnohabitans sp. T6-5]|nr:hypothetical protein B9Z51_06880 [Limnohabitans sp. T6-5]